MSVPNGDATKGTDAITQRPLIVSTANTRVSRAPTEIYSPRDSHYLYFYHQVSIPVSAATNEWIAAEVLRDAFLHSVNGLEISEEDPATSNIIFSAKFLAYAASNLDGSNARLSVLRAAVAEFTQSHLATSDIHTLVASYDPETRKEVLSAYFLAIFSLEARLPSDQVPRAAPSALFTAAKNGKASIYGLFGGQGTNEVYFDELKSLFDIYGPYVKDLVATISNLVLKPLAAKADVDGFSFYAHGFDVLAWLEGTVEVPPTEYLASIPISFPLIGLTQLVQYLATASALNLTPGELRGLIHGTVGHSQGIVSAVAIAASTTVDSYITNASKAAKWLFYSGLRGQEAFPLLSLEPRLVADSVEGGEGTPTPMLAISGLTLKALAVHIEKTNSHLADNSQLTVSLHNGAKNFVVTGPSKALYGLVTALRKVRAPSGLDQSKVPFSQRKVVFSMRFLVVNVPYHSAYLAEAAQKVTDIDLSGEELWTPSDLAIPVYHTEDGKLFHLIEFDA